MILGDEDERKKVGVNVVVVESESNVSSLSKEDYDNDTYVERDALQEETVMMETKTIKINQTADGTPPNLVVNKVNNSSSNLQTKQLDASVPCHSVLHVPENKRDSSSYDDIPLPPSPRQICKQESGTNF